MQTSLNLRPGDGSDSARIQLRDPPRNFLTPFAICVLVYLCVDAFEKRTAKAARPRGNRKSLFQEVASVFRYASIVVIPENGGSALNPHFRHYPDGLSIQ